MFLMEFILLHIYYIKNDNYDINVYIQDIKKCVLHYNHQLINFM